VNPVVVAAHPEIVFQEADALIHVIVNLELAAFAVPVGVDFTDGVGERHAKVSGNSQKKDAGMQHPGAFRQGLGGHKKRYRFRRKRAPAAGGSVAGGILIRRSSCLSSRYEAVDLDVPVIQLRTQDLVMILA